MIVDTSALIAILHVEPEAVSYARAIENSGVRRVSAAIFVEAAVITQRRAAKWVAISYSKKGVLDSHLGGRISSINRLFRASNGLTNLTPANAKPSCRSSVSR